jgi:iron complex outermembrane recepter protein
MRQESIRRVHPGLAWFAIATLLAFTAAAEQPGAALRGTVFTGRNVGLPGVTVTLAGPGQAKVTAVSGEAGVWAVSGLQPGRWEIRAELAGFATATSGAIDLAVGQTRHVEIAMEPATFFDTTSVTGKASEGLLSSGEIRETSARELDDALTRVAGIHRLRKGGIASDVVLRGYQGANLNLLLDGAKVQGACPGHMDPPAFHADLAEIDRVEVTPGPFDVRTAGSLGGLVNLVGKRPEPGFGVTANLTAGTASFVNPSATVTGGSDAASFLGGLSYRSSKAYADGDGKQFTELTNYKADARDSDAFRIGTGWARVALVPAEGNTVQLGYTRQQADHVLYPYLTMDTKVDDTDRATAEYTRDGHGGLLGTVRASAYYTKVYHVMDDALRTSSATSSQPWSMSTTAETSTWGGRAETGLGPVTVGAEGSRRSWITKGRMASTPNVIRYAIPDVATDNAGIYATYHTELSRRFTVDAGARYDHTTTDADPALADTALYQAYHLTRATSASDSYGSGHLRLSASLSSHLAASAGVGSTVRVPDAQERFYAARRMSGSDWVGDPGLKPTRATGLHLGLETRATPFAVTLNAYEDRLNDYVTVYDQQRQQMVPGVMNKKARSYANVAGVMRGAELAASVPLGQGWFASGNVSWVRGTQTSRPEVGINSQNLAEIPPLSSRLTLRWDSGKLFLEGEGVFAAAQDNVNADVQETATPGWGIANLRGGFRFKGASVSLAVNNVANRQYMEHLSYQRDPYRSGVRLPEPGRTLTVNLATSF